jgi:hypothetical protein
MFERVQQDHSFGFERVEPSHTGERADSRYTHRSILLIFKAPVMEQVVRAAQLLFVR